MRKILIAAITLILANLSYAQSDSAAFYLNKGLEEKTKGRRMESLKHFEKAYSYDQKNKKIVGELASAYYDLRRYSKAKEKYVQLEGLGDKTDSTYRQLMLLSSNLRHFDDVIKYASSLKKVKPSEPTAIYLAKAFYGKEDLGNAIKYFGFAEKEHPNDANIPYTVARAYADMFNYKEAIQHFHKAIKLNPNPRWYYELALIYYALPDNINALKYMLEAGEKGYKKDNEYNMNLAVAYLNAGKPQEGLNILKDMLARRPSDVNIINMIAEAYYDTKQYDLAIDNFDKILQMDNKNAEALYMIGMCFQKKGEKAKGQALCDEAIKLDPSLENLKQKKQMPGF